MLNTTLFSWVLSVKYNIKMSVYLNHIQYENMNVGITAVLRKLITKQTRSTEPGRYRDVRK